MNALNPVEPFLKLFHSGGPLLLVAGLLLVAYTCVGRITRVLGLAILLLVLAQSWFPPANLLGKNLRWPVLLVICARGIVLCLRTPRPSWDSGRGRVLAGALGAVALASCLWADRRGDQFFDDSTLVHAASFLISLIAAFWVLWRLYDVEDVLAAACRGALVCAFLLFGAEFAWYLAAKLTGAWRVLDVMVSGDRFGGIYRFRGIFFNANMNGVLGMLLLPAIVATPRAWLGRAAGLRWFAVLLCAAALYLSGSRASILGALVALTILFLYRYGAGALLTVAIGTVAIYVVATTTPVEDIDASAVGHITRTKHLNTLSGRVQLWEEGFDAVRGNEVLGLGWGSSRLLHGADADDAVATGGFSRRASNLHSTHVQILVDIGLVGASILWLLCLRVLWAGWRLLLMPRTERSIVSVMVLASFVAALADTFVHGSVLSTGSPSALIFWSAAALLLREADRARYGIVAGAPAPEPVAAPIAPAPALPAPAVARSG